MPPSEITWLRKELYLLLHVTLNHVRVISYSHTQSLFSAFIGGIFPQNSYIPPNNLRIRQKSATCAAKKLLASGGGALPPDSVNRGSARGPRKENSHQAPQQWCQSIGVHDMRTPPVFGHVMSNYYMQMCKKASVSGGLLPPDPRNFAPRPHWRTSEVPIPQIP